MFFDKSCIKGKTNLLGLIELKILKSHLEGCLKDSIECKNSGRAQELIDEVMDIVTKVKQRRL